MTQLLAVKIPRLDSPNELPLRTQLLTVNVPKFQIPVCAFLMVRPEIAAGFSGKKPKTNNAWFPSIESCSAPGPEIVMFLLIGSAPLVSVIVPVTAKLIVSPSWAIVRARRNEPGPLSFVLVTVRGAACAGIAPTQDSTVAR